MDRAQAAAKEHATVARAQEEAVRNDITPAQDKEPRGSDNSPRSDPVQLSKSTLQQQVISTGQAGAVRVSHSSFRLAPFDARFKQGEEIQQRVMVLERQMNACLLETGCLEEVKATVTIQVDGIFFKRRGVNCRIWEGYCGNGIQTWSILLCQIICPVVAPLTVGMCDL